MNNGGGVSRTALSMHHPLPSPSPSLSPLTPLRYTRRHSTKRDDSLIKEAELLAGWQRHGVEESDEEEEDEDEDDAWWDEGEGRMPRSSMPHGVAVAMAGGGALHDAFEHSSFERPPRRLSPSFPSLASYIPSGCIYCPREDYHPLPGHTLRSSEGLKKKKESEHLQ